LHAPARWGGPQPIFCLAPDANGPGQTVCVGAMRRPAGNALIRRCTPRPLPAGSQRISNNRYPAGRPKKNACLACGKALALLQRTQQNLPRCKFYPLRYCAIPGVKIDASVRACFIKSTRVPLNRQLKLLAPNIFSSSSRSPRAAAPSARSTRAAAPPWVVGVPWSMCVPQRDFLLGA
jgi:hypothetical protein